MGEQQSGEYSADDRSQHVDEEESSAVIRERGLSPAEHQSDHTRREVSGRVESGLGQRSEQADGRGKRCADEERRCIIRRLSGVAALCQGKNHEDKDKRAHAFGKHSQRHMNGLRSADVVVFSEHLGGKAGCLCAADNVMNSFKCCDVRVERQIDGQTSDEGANELCGQVNRQLTCVHASGHRHGDGHGWIEMRAAEFSGSVDAERYGYAPHGGNLEDALILVEECAYGDGAAAEDDQHVGADKLSEKGFAVFHESFSFSVRRRARQLISAVNDIVDKYSRFGLMMTCSNDYRGERTGFG